MSKFSSQYSSKLVIAKELASLGARAVTITAIARTRPADSRIVHRDVRGHQSQSGRTPTDHEWFLANRTRRMHAAFLLVSYAKYRQAHEESPDSHGLAFTMAYRDYVKVCKGKPLAPIERVNLLISNGYGIGWRNITKGGSSKFPSGNVKVINCKRCRTPHLVEEHSLSYICAAC